MRTLYFDCFSGAAGDMIVGALIDAGADFGRIRDSLMSLGVQGFDVAIEKVKKKGVMATKFHVNIAAQGHPHRHLKHIVEIIEKGDLPQNVKAASLETFRRIAQAEADVHGSTPEKVHFHEVGAVDSIVDIVGAHLALDQLKPDRIEASSLHVGSGTVKCAHGVMPVPAPATALLLKNVPSYGGEVEGELVTPTGAALIAQLAQKFGPQPELTVDSVGAGAGTRDLPDRPNVLRVLIGQAASVSTANQTIVVIEANIDDMNPELFPPLVHDLLAAGARDAFLTPILGKKGRPAHLVTALADDAAVSRVTDTLFRGSSTLGLRMRREERICLDREWKNVRTPWGEVRVKLGRRNGSLTNSAPEFEDCARVAESAKVTVRQVYDAAHAAATRGEWTNA
jgi:uncharacterized protein (TIGR00299 family) protein